ncbi:signal transduction histidine kinase/ligand-binding sensor domain-containing protein [Duganella sp. 1224]|uniref:sensor histidine kinase n=1 Tax=Duganella sp. 1224 TaxID=2587052 RepID=UPI0015C82819|nr:sensor histidine kinase [Duganella sp. 1224]NYE62890.1 signal transduction histidine kinase/ligand-binding sensor domain-containing protein [Duganella sp. 1224]
MLRIWVAVFCALLCGASFAIPLERKLSQLQHQSWTAKDGVPPSPGTMAQTDDGYLWLGTNAGLYRFDGVRFELFQPRSGSLPRGYVYFLKAQPGVGLWIGWGVGGISLVRDGAAINYGVEQGVSGGSWWGFDFDRQGGVWAAGVDGLVHFDGKQWRRIGQQQGFTAKKASAIFVDREGTVGAFSEQGLFLKPANSAVFHKPIGHTDVRQPPQLGPDGRIYFMEESSIRVIDSLARYEQADHAPIFKGKPGAAQSMLIDRSGSLWYETQAGLHRTDPDHPAMTERFRKTDGLSADIIYSFFEDREGNIWLATSDGIDRFRQVDVNRVTPSLGTYVLGQSHLLAGDGNVMTAVTPNFDGGWVALTPDGVVQNTDWLKRHPGGHAQSGIRVPDGSFLLADRAGLHRVWPNKKEETIGWPADMGPVHLVRQVIQDRDGAPWISVVATGVYQYKDGQWRRHAALPKEGKQTPMSMLADSQGRLWFGYPDNKIALLQDGKVSLLSPAQGMDLGRVLLLYEADGQVIAGGERGLAVYRKQRFQAWKVSGHTFMDVAAIVVTKAGDVWINAASGTVRITGGLRDFLQGVPSAPSQVRVFDAIDGRLGVSSVLQNFSVAEAGDGKIWLADGGGLSWIDPAHLLKAPLPPPVTVESLKAGEQHFRLPSNVTLAPGARDVQLNYSSPILGTPERMRFRYRLDGYDTEWRDAGARRQAFYTGLPPGQYHFRVIAANGGDHWSEEGPGLRFTLTPNFYQTLWFKALCAGAAAWLVWLAFQLRLKQTAKAFKAQLEARHGERERIARELHDTLLQGMQALILGVDSAAKRLPPDEPARARLDRLLLQADIVLSEGRKQVLDVRGTEVYDEGVFALLSRDGAVLAKDGEVQFASQVFGKQRELQPASSHEIYRIGMEAIVNAVRHARASKLTVTMRYTRFALHLDIGDDGVGMPPQVLEQRGTPGHFGLPGLYERASRLDAELHIVSRPGAGTVVGLRVPARLAYARRSLLPAFLRRQRVM